MDEHYRQRKQDNIDQTVGLIKDKLSSKVQKILQESQKNRDRLIENGTLIPDEHDEEKKQKKKQEKLDKIKESYLKTQRSLHEPNKRYKANFSSLIERHRELHEQEDGEVEFDPKKNDDSIISSQPQSKRAKTKSTLDADRGPATLQGSLIGRDFIRMSKALDFNSVTGRVAKRDVVSVTEKNLQLEKVK